MSPSPPRASALGGLLAAFAMLVIWLALQPAPTQECQDALFFASSRPLLLLVAAAPIGAVAGAIVGRRTSPTLQSLGFVALLTVVVGALVFRGSNALAAVCVPEPRPDGSAADARTKDDHPVIDAAAQDTFDRFEDLLARAIHPAGDAGVSAASAAQKVFASRPGGPSHGRTPPAGSEPGQAPGASARDGGPFAPDAGVRLDGGGVGGETPIAVPSSPASKHHPAPKKDSIDPAMQAALLAACLAASDGNAAACAIFGSLLNLGFGGDGDTKIEWTTNPATGKLLPKINGKSATDYLEEQHAAAKKKCDVLPPDQQQACKNEIDAYIASIQDKEMWARLLEQVGIDSGALLDTIDIVNGQCTGSLQPKEAVYLGCCARSLIKDAQNFCQTIQGPGVDSSLAMTFLDQCRENRVQNVRYDEAFVSSFLMMARAMCQRAGQ